MFVDDSCNFLNRKFGNQGQFGREKKPRYISNDMYKENLDDYIRDSKRDDEFKNFSRAKQLVSDYQKKVLNYVAAILDPEFNYTSGIMVKQPSLLNTPSVSIPIRTLSTIKSLNYNSLCVAWNPSFFCTSNKIGRIQLGIDKTAQDKPVMANRICSVLYATGNLRGNLLSTPPSAWDANVYGLPDNLPDIGVAKARLVSSKIKISFRGAVLSQGGTIMGCATYEGVPGVVASSDEDLLLRKKDQKAVTWADLFKITNPEIDTTIDPSPFDEKIISNGIWSKNVNITKDANGITAIFVPSDPMDEIFYQNGTYYGEPIEQKSVEIQGNKTSIWLNSSKGAHLNFLFNVQGIPEGNTNPITIETFTTWEVIPTNRSASSLRNYNGNGLSLEQVIDVKEIINQYYSTKDKLHTLRDGQTNRKEFGNVLDDIWDGVKWAAKKLVS